MAAAAWAIYGLLTIYVSSKIAVIVTIGAAIVIYLILVILLKAVTKEDLMMFPKGEKIARQAERLRRAVQQNADLPFEHE